MHGSVLRNADANNTTKTLSGGPAGGVYPHFCEGLQTAWFAARLQQIFFPVQCRRPADCMYGSVRGSSGSLPLFRTSVTDTRFYFDAVHTTVIASIPCDRRQASLSVHAQCVAVPCSLHA
jgi:hypothetical protein